MPKIVCTVCDASIDVPQAGRNVCPVCGNMTACFAPPTWTEAQMHAVVRVVARTSVSVGRRQGFIRGFAAGAGFAIVLYWACNLAAKYLF